MKVLWLTHMVLPNLAVALNKAPSPRGGWMPTLANELADQENLELAIATPTDTLLRKKFSIENILYYAVPCARKNLQRSQLNLALINNYKEIIDEFQPDIIHVHGTEYFEGLLTARQHITQPAVVSIQGIIDVCRHQYYGGISLRKVIAMRTLRDWVRCDGLTEQKIKWRYRAAREREIFLENQSFIGRTTWDRAHVAKYNPNARYHHCDEMLRPPFHKKKWDINSINKHSIFASSADYPLKGFHILVKAVALLKHEFPNIIVKTPLANFSNAQKNGGSIIQSLRATGYSKYISKLISKHKIENCFMPLPAITGKEMADEFKQSHAFVLPSLMENSPNSLAEAMLVGTPSVVSYVGGTPSMAKDGDSALFFPQNDEAVLAEQLRKIFSNDKLAIRLSENARNIALLRHDKEKIVSDTLNIYKKEIQVSKT